MDKIANSNDDIISVTLSDSESREGFVPMSTSGTFSSTGPRGNVCLKKCKFNK